MSIGAVTLDNGLSPWLSSEAGPQVATQPGAVAAHLRHAASRGVVVAAGDLIALAIVVAVFVPHLLQWWVPAFVAGVLVLSALRGNYRTRITMSVARDVGSVATSVAVPLIFLGLVLDLASQERSLLEVGIAAACAILFFRAAVYGAVRAVR